MLLTVQTVPLFTFNKDSQKYIGPAQKKEKEAELASKEDKRKEREVTPWLTRVGCVQCGRCGCLCMCRII